MEDSMTCQGGRRPRIWSFTMGGEKEGGKRREGFGGERCCPCVTRREEHHARVPWQTEAAERVSATIGGGTAKYINPGISTVGI